MRLKKLNENFIELIFDNGSVVQFYKEVPIGIDLYIEGKRYHKYIGKDEDVFKVASNQVHKLLSTSK